LHSQSASYFGKKEIKKTILIIFALLSVVEFVVDGE
jgi:hypothetical protein